MPGSSSHHSSRSFDETSALLPIETNAERPSPRASARSSSARPSAPDCDEKPIRPAGKARGAKVALRPTAAVAIPRQFGPDEARAVGAHERQQLLLARDALGPGLGEARRDDAERARPRAQRFLGGGEHELAGKADHAEVDRIADLLERAVGAHAGDGLTGAVDGIGGAGEPAREDVAEQLAADRPAPRRGADHGDRARLEERAQRRGHRDVVALVDSRAVALGRLDREPHLDDAAVERARRHEAGVLEHGEHACCSRAAPRR